MSWVQTDGGGDGEADGGSKIQVILVILLALVILGALAAAFLGKKKK